MLGSAAVTATEQSLGGEDFSWMLLQTPGALARLGVRPPKDGYAAKNTLLGIITAERQIWKKPEQLAANSSSHAAPQAPATPPANAIARPEWGS